MSQYFDNDKNIKSEKRLIKFNFNNKEFSIYSDNGVFSKDRFDYGTRVLLSSIDIDSLSGNVLDLGCGLGVVGIILGTDSSGTKAIQRLGRVIRKEPDKQAEVFYLIINNTVETKWFSTAHQNQPYITIDEEGLNDVLAGKEPKPYVKKIKDFTFRY